jgi:hypothetical protein
MSLLSDLSANPVLIEYAQNASQLRIGRVADFLAPTVSVASKVGRYKVYNAKSRFRLPDTRRSPGNPAVQVGFGADDGTYSCTINGVDVPLDASEIQEGRLVGLNAAMEAADLAAEIAMLSHEKGAIDLALATAGAGTDVNVNSATTDIVDSIDTGILTIRQNVPYGGNMETRLLFGATAWKRFKNAPVVRSRFVAAGNKAIPNVSEEMASSLFIGNPKIMVSNVVADTAGEGVTPSYSYLLDTGVLIFVASSIPTRTDPSWLKTFRQTGQWLGPRAYTTQDGRGEVFGFDWSFDIKAVNSAAGARVNVTVA